jgi:hypothetical protein
MSNVSNAERVEIPKYKNLDEVKGCTASTLNTMRNMKNYKTDSDQKVRDNTTNTWHPKAFFYSFLLQLLIYRLLSS